MPTQEGPGKVSQKAIALHKQCADQGKEGEIASLFQIDTFFDENVKKYIFSHNSC